MTGHDSARLSLPVSDRDHARRRGCGGDARGYRDYAVPALRREYPIVQGL